MEELRERIAENDRAILESLNRRLELVAELHGYKAAHGYELVDPARESWLVEHLAQLNTGPLSPEGLREFFVGLLGLTKREIAG